MKSKSFSSPKRFIIVAVVAVLLLAAGHALAADQPETKPEFGALSVLPPLVAITLCIITKEVIPSLFIGAWVAGTMLSGWNPINGFGKSVEFLWNSLGDPWGARIVLTSLTMGGLVGIMRIGGGIDAAVRWITSRIKTAKGALLATELAGFIIFFEDYVNTLVVGTTMGPITEDYKISKEKLSYIVDATAAPLACIAGISSWIAYMVGQIGTQFNDLGISFSAYVAYLKSIPFVLYNIIALVLLTYVILSERDIGPMLAAERRARKTGKLLRDGAQPLIMTESDELAPSPETPRRLINFIVPLVSLVGLIFLLLIRTGGWPQVSLAEAIGEGSSSIALVWGSFGSVLITIVLYRIQGLTTLSNLFKGFMEGMRSIFFGTLILVFAWGIGSAIKEVGTAKFIVNATSGILSPGLIPLITFITGAIISFSTGTSYGTMAVLMPIVVPLLYSTSTSAGLDPMVYMFATIGAVFAGAVFGDHCSPISDTTIMSSMFSGADHIDHVNTQIPYAILAAVGALVGYLGVALGLPIIINLIIAAVISLGLFRILSKPILEPGASDYSAKGDVKA
ncbi:MAG: Na+/H+ antiporter NhaC family protein [Firmicutes bacterium]|jgi:Na+/H+ antiporter NhaC|nr:Na+/H+ antiporter NhaC family protein [Bacillota bacterium]